MKKKLQKVFAILLVVCMAMSLLSVSAFAAGDESKVQIVSNGERIYYLADPEEGEEAGEDNFDVWTSKTIAGTENEDEFEVTLQVGTTVKPVPNDIAVVLVMDVSGSMMADEDGNRWYDNNMPEGKKRRIEYTHEAAMAFAEAYVENAGSAERMLSVVQFGNNAMTLLPWTNANDSGALSETAKDALEAVEVNFTVDPERDNWDKEQALEDFGQVDYWDSRETPAVMADHFADYFQNSCQSAEMSDHFCSYLETTEEAPLCTYLDCERTGDHTHCAYKGCTEVTAHTHCAKEGCVLTQAHFHCTICDNTMEHTHCTYKGCIVADAHTHCTFEGCTEAAAHTHCNRCDMTSEDHTHVVGCTLDGCLTPYEGHHTHCCVRGGDSLSRYYCRYNKSSGGYGYRCKNPDPMHTHEFLDSDTAYLTSSRYFGSVWAVGTNMEAGLLLARNLVSTGLADGGAIEDIDNVYVILLSDGNPTWRTNEVSTTEVDFVGQADNDGTWAALKDIVVDGGENDIAIAEDIKEMADLYAILYSNDLESKFNVGAGHPLTGVSGADWLTKSGDYYVGADAVFNSPAADGLDTAFLQINDRIDIIAKAWTVTDELSNDVRFLDFVLNGDYANINGTSVSWSLGNMPPENPNAAGGVGDPYIYTLKYKVTLNSAEDDVKATSLAYDANEADENSNVSLPGVWTGEDASLQYLLVEKEELEKLTPEDIKKQLCEADFANVSVKGIYGDLTFVKKDGETGEPIADVGFTLKDSKGKAYGSEVKSDSEGKVTFTDIPRGKYTLEETTVPNGMQKMSDLALKESWGAVTLDDGSNVPEVINNWKIGTVVPDPDPTPTPDPDPTPGSKPTPTPNAQPEPDVNIEDEDTPMAEMPEEDVPLTDVPEEDVPLADLPEEEVPLAVLPATGDASALWMALSALSGAGLFLTRKKNEED